MKNSYIIRIIPNIFILFTVFYLVEYEAYKWDPCDLETGTCLTVNVPFDGFYTPDKQFFVKTLDEVERIIDKNGIEHLQGMYRIEYNGSDKSANVIELELVPDFKIKEK